MGRAKQTQIEDFERGYIKTEKDICLNCVCEPAIRTYIRENAYAKKCHFCKKASKHNIAASFDDVVAMILRGIHFEWNNPDDEGIAYESAEGGYQANLTTTIELLEHYNISDDESVLEAVSSAINNDQWVESNFYIGSEGKRFRWGWDAFREEIKHKKRFLFLYRNSHAYSDSEITPAEFLFRLADFKNSNLDEVSLIHKVPPKTNIYRVRVGNDFFATAKDLGAPPQKYATRSNRMSPAGIPMFYGAFDIGTAVKETLDQNTDTKDIISAGTFRPLRILHLLDLAKLPTIPSVFDIERQHLIHPLRFFRGFADDICLPVARNGSEHIDYVPTQVITEFFRHIYKTSSGQQLDGIIYRSSQNEGAEACVIFCENHQACDKGDSGDACLLRLVDAKQVSSGI